MEEKRK
jgi:hypothetical protein